MITFFKADNNETNNFGYHFFKVFVFLLYKP